MKTRHEGFGDNEGSWDMNSLSFLPLALRLLRLYHVTFGTGMPVTLQMRVAVSPSSSDTRSDDASDIIIGGTVVRTRRGNDK